MLVEKSYSSSKVEFKHLKPGDLFEFCNEVFIKIREHKRITDNSLNLETNYLCFVNDEMEVYQLEHEPLKVKRV